VKLTSVLLIILLVPGISYATRNLILKPIEVEYSFGNGYKLILKASNDGERLETVKIIKGSKVINVPQKEFVGVNSPVLNSVIVAGGKVSSSSIERPRSITIGYGAYQCELSECPAKITFEFKNDVFTSSISELPNQ